MKDVKLHLVRTATKGENIEIGDVPLPLHLLLVVEVGVVVAALHHLLPPQGMINIKEEEKADQGLKDRNSSSQ
jgi:hypothetical protein